MQIDSLEIMDAIEAEVERRREAPSTAAIRIAEDIIASAKEMISFIKKGDPWEAKFSALVIDTDAARLKNNRLDAYKDFVSFERLNQPVFARCETCARMSQTCRLIDSADNVCVMCQPCIDSADDGPAPVRLLTSKEVLEYGRTETQR